MTEAERSPVAPNPVNHGPFDAGNTRESATGSHEDES